MRHLKILKLSKNARTWNLYIKCFYLEHGKIWNKQQFNDILDALLLNHDEWVFRRGDNSHSFYIIKSGYVKINVIIQIRTINRMPVDRSKWEVTETTKIIDYTWAILRQGDYFGHEELIKSIPRLCEARWIGKTELLYVSSEDFTKFFEHDHKQLYTIHPELNLNKLLNGVLDTYTMFDKNVEMHKKAISTYAETLSNE